MSKTLMRSSPIVIDDFGALKPFTVVRGSTFKSHTVPTSLEHALSWGKIQCESGDDYSFTEHELHNLAMGESNIPQCPSYLSWLIDRATLHYDSHIFTFNDFVIRDIEKVIDYVSEHGGRIYHNQSFKVPSLLDFLKEALPYAHFVYRFPEKVLKYAFDLLSISRTGSLLLHTPSLDVYESVESYIDRLQSDSISTDVFVYNYVKSMCALLKSSVTCDHKPPEDPVFGEPMTFDRVLLTAEPEMVSSGRYRPALDIEEVCYTHMSKFGVGVFLMDFSLMEKFRSIVSLSQFHKSNTLINPDHVVPSFVDRCYESSNSLVGRFQFYILSEKLFLDNQKKIIIRFNKK